MRSSLTLVCALCLSAPALAEEVPPEKVAEVRHKQNQAEKKIEAKYGNKKPQEMSRDEFSAMQTEKSKARAEVLDKAGVNPKDFDRSAIKQNKADRAETEARIKELEKKDAAEAEAKAKAEAAKKEGGDGANIPIQRGFNEDHPVELENKGGPGGDVQVERGVPEDVQRDIDEARLQGNEAGGSPSGGGGEKKDDGKAKKKK
jgi:hypothetical protein